MTVLESRNRMGNIETFFVELWGQWSNWSESSRAGAEGGVGSRRSALLGVPGPDTIVAG